MEIEKTARLLYLYEDLINGSGIRKKDAANRFEVNERSIQRDIEDLRCFFGNQIPPAEIIYDAKEKLYRLVRHDLTCLNNSEILAVCKILLESRSMRKDEMLPIIDKLVACCVPSENRKSVTNLIANEEFHYIEPHHGKPILDGLWEIGQAVQNQQIMQIEYRGLRNSELIQRKIRPVGIIFSEYYFYLIALLSDVDWAIEREKAGKKLLPAFYRIDRIESFKVTDEHFSVPYKDRFQEGEFRKRIQFMYGGKLQRVKFKYTGISLEAVLDRLPTARILEQDEEGWIIEAEVFGKGIEMWLRSQEPWIRAIAPDEFDAEIKV